MLGIPNIETLRNNFSSFASRGSAPSVSFAQRFGGYQGASAVVQPFKFQTEDVVRRAVPTDSRSFSAALEDIGETPAASYTKPPEPTPEPSFSTIPPDFLSNLTASQTYAQRTEADASLTNVASALRATEENAVNNLDVTPFSKFKAGFRRFNPEGEFQIRNFAQPEDFTPYVPEEPILDTYQQPTLVEPPAPVYEPPPYEPSPPPPYEPPPYQPPIYEPPRPAVTPQPTYSRAAEEDDSDEEIDSIDVVGTSRDDEQIDSVDVTGRSRRERDYVDEARQQAAPQQQYYEGDNPWERFKMLYADFMTGGRGGAVLKDFNNRETSGEFGYEYNPMLSPDSFVQAYQNNLGKDTNEIYRAQMEKEQLDTRAGEIYRNQSDMAGATIINNNQTIATTKSGDSRTARIFSDDNSFNRAAAADQQHPRYG